MRSNYWVRTLSTLVLAIGLLQVQGQLLEQHARDTARVYRTLERALKNPDQVYVLKLHKQKLKEFPMEILELKNLNVLDLGNNKLRAVPDQLSELEFLQELNLMKNKMLHFPLAVCKLKHLKRLNMSQNYIDGFPKEIGQLTELEVLDMWSNDLGEFPDELEDLKSLKWLDLRTIQITDEEQQFIKEKLPQVNIFFSNPCNCGF